ncbi:hypothetical protein ACWD4L_46750 [Streptomyces sp. NPDC002596]
MRPLPGTAARATGSGPALVRPAARHVQTLDTYKGSGSRDSPYPDRDLNSTDRLWRFHAPGVTRW